MSRFEVEFYEKTNGEQPAKEFMLGLDKKLRAKLADTIVILQDNGYELRECIPSMSRRAFLNCVQNRAPI